MKWIKYLAISFALVLALGIISTIINGSLALINAFGFLNDQIINYEDGDFNKNFEGDLDTVIIKVSAGDIILKTGDEFMVQGNKDFKNLSTKLEDRVLTIEYQPDLTNVFNFLNQKQSPQIRITLPDDLNLKNLEMELGAGKATISGINSDSLNLQQGAGKIVATKVKAKTGSLDGGAGSVIFKDSQLNNFEFNGGVGKIDFQGVLTGNIEINAGIGEISLATNGKISDYFIISDPGLGSIKANGKNISKGELGLESAKNHINIDGGIGPVNLIIR